MKPKVKGPIVAFTPLDSTQETLFTILNIKKNYWSERHERLQSFAHCLGFTHLAYLVYTNIFLFAGKAKYFILIICSLIIH